MTIAHQPINVKDLQIRPLTDHRALDNFNSGEPEVDRNIKRCCDKHQRYRNRVFCAFLSVQPIALGYYCLSISATESKYLDSKILSSSDTFAAYVPFIYLNYLAVRAEFQGNKIGTILLLNALEKSAHVIRNVGIYGVSLNALNDRSAGLYDRYGFREYGKRATYPFMVLPAQSVLELFADTN